MKRIVVFAVLLFSLNLVTNAQTDNSADIRQIKMTILNSYQDGLQNEGDTLKIDQGFHPSFRMIAINAEGQLWEYPIGEWKKAVLKGKGEGKYPRPAEKKVTIEFPMIDVAGTAAIAKLNFFVGGKLTYVDYMSLYKMDGTWKIVAKIYSTVK